MIDIEKLAFTYPDGTRALDSLSLRVKRGESVGIAGSNGAGKSTLVSHLNAWHLPQAGAVRIGGVVAGRKTVEEIRKKVGLVFQKPDDQLFMARVYDDVLFGPSNLGMSESESRAEAERLLRLFGLWELRDKPPAHLSQGQKRFAALAAVLVMKPELLVMDEPTSDLDPRNRRMLIGLVNGLQTTKLTVSHDLDFIWETCQRVCIMNKGKIIADGPTKQILADRELLESNGLELPLRLQGG
ncbi:cobalt ABC transporter ATP-binding protein [Chlorobaculum limnaeum]|uniref:Cobalt ABC transporter ATP-binding protein n=1 Tax=Chlorobaculum limnaeum TaxID=274537 RepID=A0A1D8D3G2_CHLLM|nr:ATP-binding cassette domain-containing protein [Chlorobaculum limnaeum]AOS84265.1 cobalt ABC transporter ATP-binding protein [Chlorobaculum limnaeum]